MRRLLLRDVWPEPRPEDVELLRPLDRGVVVVEGKGWVATLRSSGVSVSTSRIEIIESIEQKSSWKYPAWPALPEVPASWKAASMIAAIRNVEKERPQDPVGYKVFWSDGVLDPEGAIVPPRRIMGPAKCLVRMENHTSPNPECTCGFHAARSVTELVLYYPTGKILVVTPVGRTIWHANAWRAEYYQVHAAIVPPDWHVPDDWGTEVPIVRALTPLIPYKAYEVAREIKAMIDLEGGK